MQPHLAAATLDEFLDDRQAGADPAAAIVAAMLVPEHVEDLLATCTTSGSSNISNSICVSLSDAISVCAGVAIRTAPRIHAGFGVIVASVPGGSVQPIGDPQRRAACRQPCVGASN